MNRIFFCLFALMLPQVSHARLGETEAQLQERFGTPSSRGKDMMIAQGHSIDLCPTLTFRQDDWTISCNIIDGRSSQESYRKTGDWTEDQILLVLTSNTQGAKWQETTNPSIKKLKREWRREDGATALWQLGIGFTLTHPSYPLAKKKAEDKAKANASKLPNL